MPISPAAVHTSFTAMTPPLAWGVKPFVGAERDIAKGEQLLHTYGDLSDAQLLQTYGFVEDFEPGYDNPHNFVPVPTVLLLQSCSEAGDEVCCSNYDASGSDSIIHLK